jgi:small-conductance mechanosensitive channel
MQPLNLTAVLAGATVAGMATYLVAFRIARRRLARTGATERRALVAKLRAPSRLVLPLAGLEIALASVRLPGTAGSVLTHVVGTGLVAAIAWFAVRTTFVFDDLFLRHYRLDADDNLRARRIHTQIQVLRRITVVVVSVIAAAVILLSFSAVRAEGEGLLASAGLVGIMVGIAARPTATNVVAGMQIALSQPIRVDDVVVVETQWGRIEEIALTYVVVRVWDLRRLVLPISYFVDQPFENWTRSTADILGWVYVEVDYTAPVEDLRRALREIVAGSPNWNGKVCGLQVTNLGSETMQLRALMSSADSTRSWDLQCEVRERLVRYLQDHHPGSLPRQRTEVVVESRASAEARADRSRLDLAGDDGALVGR